MTTRQSVLNRIGAWTLSFMAAAAMLFGAGSSAQEVLPAAQAPFKGQIGLSGDVPIAVEFED